MVRYFLTTWLGATLFVFALLSIGGVLMVAMVSFMAWELIIPPVAVWRGLFGVSAFVGFIGAFLIALTAETEDDDEEA